MAAVKLDCILKSQRWPANHAVKICNAHETEKREKQLEIQDLTTTSQKQSSDLRRAKPWVSNWERHWTVLVRGTRWTAEL